MANYGERELLAGVEVVLLHPLADDSADDLEEIGVKPTDCRSCDLYSDVGGGLFLSVDANNEIPEVFSFHRTEGPHPNRFFARVHTGTVDRAIMATVLQWALRALAAGVTAMEGEVVRLPMGMTRKRP